MSTEESADRTEDSADLEGTDSWRMRLSFWWWLHRERNMQVAVWLIGLLALSGIAYLVDRDSHLALDYMRVLVWPIFAALAILLLRRPILELLRGLYLKEVDVRGRLSFGRREQEASDPDGLPDDLFEVVAQAEQQLDELETLRLGQRIAGALLQSFQTQIDFLRVVAQARDGLTREAAEDWFRDALEERNQDLQDWNVGQLVSWLLDNELLQRTPENRLRRSTKGDYLIAIADSFWYAPKAI